MTLVVVSTGKLNFLSMNSVFTATLGRIQSSFGLICQGGLVFQQPITEVQPAWLWSSLQRASETELTATMARQAADVASCCQSLAVTSGDQLAVQEQELADRFQWEQRLVLFFSSSNPFSCCFCRFPQKNWSQSPKSWDSDNICPEHIALRGCRDENLYCSCFLRQWKTYPASYWGSPMRYQEFTSSPHSSHFPLTSGHRTTLDQALGTIFDPVEIHCKSIAREQVARFPSVKLLTAMLVTGGLETHI